MANLNVTASVTALVPQAEVPALVGALLAAVPPDVMPTNATISISFPSSATGDGTFSATIGASMSDGDLVAFLPALVKALPADAVLQAGSLVFSLPPAP